jgi:hypothetical protein
MTHEVGHYLNLWHVFKASSLHLCKSLSLPLLASIYTKCVCQLVCREVALLPGTAILCRTRLPKVRVLLIFLVVVETIIFPAC